MAKIKVTKRKGSEEDSGEPTYKYRYVASLQDIEKQNLYRDFIQSNTLVEIKNKSVKEVADALKEDGLDLGVIITDRKDWFATYRYNLPEKPIVETDRKGRIKVVNDVETRIKSWVKDK